MELIEKFIAAIRAGDYFEATLLGCQIVATYGRLLKPNAPQPFMSFTENSDEDLIEKLQEQSAKESIDMGTVLTIINVVMELLKRFRRSR